MYLRSTLLPALAAYFTVLLASPLSVELSLTTTEESLSPDSLVDTTVLTDFTTSEQQAVLFHASDFADLAMGYSFTDGSCQQIEGRSKPNTFNSAIITGYGVCLFYGGSTLCDTEHLLATIPEGHHSSLQDTEGVTHIRCFLSDEAANSAELLETSEKAVPGTSENSNTGLSGSAEPLPRYKDTAKVIFWNDANFSGTKKRYQVIEDKCYNLPKNLANYVLSAKLAPKVWYCSFYPEKACEAEAGSDEVHQLPAGEFDFLFPEGLDFVSFKCKLYEKVPGSPPGGLRSASTSESSHGHLVSPFQTAMTRPGGKSSGDVAALTSEESAASEDSEVNTVVPTVQLFSRPFFNGPSSIIPFYPGTWGCVPLVTEPETAFQSIKISPEFRSCKFFSQDACRGDLLLHLKKSVPYITGVEDLPLKTMYCSFES